MSEYTYASSTNCGCPPQVQRAAVENQNANRRKDLEIIDLERQLVDVKMSQRIQVH